jgi:hypothetical protein
MVGCRAADNGEDPGAEQTRAPERGEVVVGLNERLLGDVLCGVVVMENGPGSGMDMVFVAPNEVGIGIPIAGQNFADKMVVGLHGAGFESWHIHRDEGGRDFAAIMYWNLDGI